MKRTIWLGGSAAALLALLLFLSVPTPPQHVVSTPKAGADGYTPAMLQQMEVERKKERHANRSFKPDGPDGFFRYFDEIRTRLDDPSVTYVPGYRIEALRATSAQMNKTQQQLDWRERGPANVSGRTRAIIVDPGDPTANTWYAGSAGGGIWKTTDAGASWRNLTPDLPNLATVALAQGASNPNVMYAGTGEGFFNVDAIGSGSIFKSTDRGETWQQLPATINANFDAVNRLIVDPANPDVVIAATNSGLFRSTDGGASWSMVYNTGQQRAQQVLAVPGDFNTQYATVNSTGVLKSTNGGQSWATVFPLQDGRRLELAIAPSNPNRLYAAVENGNASDLYYSRDAGTAWAALTENNPPNWLNGQGWYDNAIAVHPYDSDIVFVGGLDIYRVQVLANDRRSSTRITDWSDTSALPFVHADHHALVVVPVDPATGTFRIINGNDGGVEFSNDSGNGWNKALNGYNSTQFYGVDKAPGFDEFIGGMQDNGTWRSPTGVVASASTDWLNQLGGDGFDVAWHADDPQLIMGSIQFNNIWRSVNGGRSWRPATDGMEDEGRGAGNFITTLAKSQGDPDLLFTTGISGIWRTDTFGERWALTQMESPERWEFTGSRGLAAISVADPQVVWAGVRMTDSASLFVSDDGGLSFRPTSRYADMSAIVTGLATHPDEPQTAYALFSAADAPKILRTQNLGQTWENLSGTFTSGAALSSNGFPNVNTYSLLVMPFDPDLIWAGTEIGLFISEDAGATWSRADNGLPAASIWKMSIVDDQVVVATHGRGAWSVSLPELASYQPPEIVRAPRLNDASVSPDGTLIFDLSLRSPYDSVAVRLGDENAATFTEPTAVVDTVLTFMLEVEQPTEVTASVLAYRDGRALASTSETLTVFPPVEIAVTYENDLTTAEDGADFIGEGFTVRRSDGFFSRAIHSAHPYPDNTTAFFQLRVPIRVASDAAILSYRDVAILEPGHPDTGVNFGDPDFYDYAVVEGSKDGVNWVPLADGYDARFADAWRGAYFNNRSGDSSMFVEHEIDLLDTFAPGDIIFIRFFLFADQNRNSFGWVIDDISIQPDAVVAAEEAALPDGFSLGQNYPNPFNPGTTIPFSLHTSGRAVLTVYDLQGRRVATLADRHYTAGEHEVTWDASHLASGVYLYRLEAGGQQHHRTLTLVK